MGWNKKSEIWQWVLLSGVPVLITVVAIFLVVVVVEMKPKPQFVEGGLYASPRQEGSGYNIIKVLMIDDNGYHIRSYSNVFREVPVVLDPLSLFMVGMDETNDTQDAGMGHLPIRRQSFERWPIVFIRQVEVKEEELEGYNMWKEANGGYF